MTGHNAFLSFEDMFKSIAGRKVKIVPPPDYYAALVFDRVLMEPRITGHGEDYYKLVESTHDKNQAGDPFLFLSLVSNPLMGNAHLCDWLRNCFNHNEKRAEESYHVISPKIQAIILNLNHRIKESDDAECRSANQDADRQRDPQRSEDDAPEERQD